MWYMYVLVCGDGSFYTGATNDLARRVTAHQAGKGARYTRAHLPVQLVAAWEFPHRGAALTAEARFKALARATKAAYIAARAPFLTGVFVSAACSA